MADWEDDLLRMVGDTAEEEPKPSKSATKKRKRGTKGDSESDMEMSDTSQQAEDDWVDPYPLEGKFKDSNDRDQVLAMREIDRETLLAERQAELDAKRDRITVANMAKGVSGQRASSTRSAKKMGKHEVRQSQLQELAKKRDSQKRRAEKRALNGEDDSPKKPELTWSDSEPEEGEYDSDDRPKKPKKKERKSKKEAAAEERMSEADLKAIFTPRHEMMKNWSYPWFSDFVTGAWIRLCIGTDTKAAQPGNVYRVCEILGMATPALQPYKLENGDFCDVILEVRHGLAKKTCRIDEASNGTSDNLPYDRKEFLRLINTYEAEQVDLPLAKEAQKKSVEMRTRRKTPNSDLDDTMAFKRRKQLDPNSKRRTAAQIDHLKTQLATAVRDGRQDLVEQLSKQIETSDERKPSTATVEAKNLTTVSDRNRQINRAEVRKAEIAAHQRRAALEQAGMGKYDPSARVKTNVRLMHDVRMPGSGTQTPTNNGQDTAITQAAIDASTVKALHAPSKWEEAAKSVQIDLDF